MDSLQIVEALFFKYKKTTQFQSFKDIISNFLIANNSNYETSTSYRISMLAQIYSLPCPPLWNPLCDWKTDTTAQKAAFNM